MRLVILGPPGAGKGTQAAKVAEQLGVPHIATGDMLRKSVAQGTELGREAETIMAEGGLVPDDLVIGMLMERLERDDAEAGFILDGFPRNETQAEALAAELGPLDMALAVSVEDVEIVRRLSGRRTCPNQHVYHIEDNPPNEPGVCDLDGLTLFQRDDDREEVIHNRLAVYRRETEPLVDHYRSLGILEEVNGSGQLEEITNRILGLVR